MYLFCTIPSIVSIIICTYVHDKECFDWPQVCHSKKPQTYTSKEHICSLPLTVWLHVGKQGGVYVIIIILL